jgi:tetratricopeptide (TPR) repeat protein
MAVAAHAGIAVRCHRGRPAVLDGALEIDLGCGPPAALTGLRRILGALEAEAPEAVVRSAARYPIEWAELRPGGPRPPLGLWDVANAPVERRLLRESEQVFRLLQCAGDTLVQALAELGRPLVLRRCGSGDLISLRGLMHAVERSRSAGVTGLVVCGEWAAPARPGSIGDRKARVLERLLERMRSTIEGDPGDSETESTTDTALAPGEDSAERGHLRALLDEERPPAARLAAAVLAVRSCFYSTNYEGSLLACDHGLRLLAEHPRLDTAEIAAAFAAMDDGVSTAAVEIDAASAAGSRADLEALLWRSVGVDLSMMGDAPAGAEAFQRALARPVSPVTGATLLMYTGLLLSKRMGRLDDALVELRRGLALVETDSSAAAANAEGWLRNVVALIHFRRKELREAFQEEMRALRKVADHQDPNATHLKLNVVSNLSVVQESAGHRAEALKVWRRFREIGSGWGPNFVKHYSYREGTLELGNGDEDAAMACYQRSFDSAAAIQDSFYRAAIAAELGGHHLAAGRPTRAADWFAEAVHRGHDLGDPYRIGQAMTGLALARGEADLRPAAAVLARATTYVDPAQSLSRLIESGDREALVAALPRPGGKLNRPFDLVNA